MEKSGKENADKTDFSVQMEENKEYQMLKSCRSRTGYGGQIIYSYVDDDDDDEQTEGGFDSIISVDEAIIQMVLKSNGW